MVPPAPSDFSFNGSDLCCLYFCPSRPYLPFRVPGGMFFMTFPRALPLSLCVVLSLPELLMASCFCCQLAQWVLMSVAFQGVRRASLGECVFLTKRKEGRSHCESSSALPQHTHMPRRASFPGQLLGGSVGVQRLPHPPPVSSGSVQPTPRTDDPCCDSSAPAAPTSSAVGQERRETREPDVGQERLPPFEDWSHDGL